MDAYPTALQYLVFYFSPKILTEIFSLVKLCKAYSSHETLLVTSDYRCVSESQSSEHSYSSFSENLSFMGLRRSRDVIALPLGSAVFIFPPLISSPFS